MALMFMMVFTLQVNSTTINIKEKQQHFSFSYRFTIQNLPSDAQEVEIWIPLPTNSQYQKVTQYSINSPFSHQIIEDAQYKNRIISLKSGGNIPQNVTISLNLDIIRQEVDPTYQKNMVSNQQDLKRFLQPDSLVPITGKIALEAQAVVNDNMTPWEKIKALYEHLNRTMKYDKTGTGWGNGDAIYACDYRKGNCTDIHSLFIGMVRSLGIPARFTIGFPLPENKAQGAVNGYHCWAEFYLKDQGWVPVDISEAIKHPEKREYYFGHLDPNRISFSTGRDIKLNTNYGVESLNYFIYPYVLVDGKPFYDIKKSFRFKRQ
ncbi:MAG: transglutaminase domain-containing protein [FCB group bacterium]|nr:transglutaminase domain-containing protein [FCB group bacterium]